MAKDKTKGLDALKGRGRKLDENGTSLPDNKGRRLITQEQRAMCIALSDEGAAPEEIALSLNLSIWQVERALKAHHESQVTENLAVVVQKRENLPSADRRVAQKATDIMMRCLTQIETVIADETDVSKLSTCLKTLYAIHQSSEVKTAVTTTISRLRQM